MINTQQTELHQMLESLEQEVTNLANESDMGPIDIEREKGYYHPFNSLLTFTDINSLKI